MKGLDIFREHFAGADHNYVLIGGAACEIIMQEVELEFRATKDLDLVLLVESLDKAFGEKFWAFVQAGGYQQRERSSGGKEFYRFHSPENAEYPSMLELFARAPDSLELAAGAALTPLPIDEDIASLSAILLDKAYYEALKANNRVVDGVAVLDERMLIPSRRKRISTSLGARRPATRSTARPSASIAPTCSASCSCSPRTNGPTSRRRSGRISGPSALRSRPITTLSPRT